MLESSTQREHMELQLIKGLISVHIRPLNLFSITKMIPVEAHITEMQRGCQKNGELN